MNSGVKERNTEEEDSKRPTKRRAWTYVGLMMLCILLSLPITPTIWKWALDAFGEGINSIAYVAFFFLFLGFGFFLFCSPTESRLKDFSILAVFVLLYLYLLKYQCRFPAERLHMVEYGVLAYLLYAALRIDFAESKAYALGFVIASAFGLFDEFIQFILPNRFFEMRDVATNIIGAGLGLLVIKFLVKPDPLRTRAAGALR